MSLIIDLQTDHSKRSKWLGVFEPKSFAPRTAVSNSDASLTATHRELALWNQQRLGPAMPTTAWRAELDHERSMREVESDWIERLRIETTARAAEAPRDPAAFVAWFESLKQTGPGQDDALFPWLAEEATLGELRWFLRQESAGEAGFDDLVALTQVKMPTVAKLELAANYWDEMGRGNLGGMHGPMLDRTNEDLDLRPSIATTCWQSLALANTMTAFATTRRYAWHSVGALGVVELTAPGRVALVAAGLKRHGVEPRTRKYFDLHAVLDVKHSADWNENALKPLVAENPDCARFIAEGALMRLECGRRCFDAYREHFRGSFESAASGEARRDATDRPDSPGERISPGIATR